MADAAQLARKSPDAWLKPGVALGTLFPALQLGWRAQHGTLGANPIAEALNALGLIALVLLVASLACTPARVFWGWTFAARIRRLLGLMSFFYATLHVLVYLCVDRLGEVATVLEDVLERPFITVGLAAWLVLLPLALTSTRGMLKQLGFRRWQRLHRLSYLAGLLATIHFVWRVKKDLTEPLTYGLLLLFLLALRFSDRIRARS